ncbi:hypothetical protein ACAN81_20460 [Bacillus velezensis]|uniref:hypothetical protein n=1 Tax=Bacillus velezensis TaxID=492670 RepID=UPI0007B6F0D1|nr:hypothetical protein A6R78_17430 [Bacillus velezensis]
MKKFFIMLLNKIAVSAIGSLVTPVVVSVASKFVTGSWTELLFTYPVIISIAVIVVWFFACLIYKIITFRKSNSPFWTFLPSGGIKIAEHEYKGVVWDIYSEIDVYGRVIIGSVYAKETAKCPNCKTELEETSTFWGSYKWKCIHCLKFKKTNKFSLYEEAQRVTKIAKREVEKRLESG